MTDPLVLIPGLQSDASSWLPLMERLGRHFPLSVPYGHQHAPSIAAMAETVLSQSAVRFHLVGWSMGGYIAFEILRQCPERLASLTLIATTAAPEGPESLARRRDALSRARENGLRGYQIANLQNCLYAPHAFQETDLEALLQSSHHLGYDALANQIKAISARPDSIADLSDCPCPVLIIAGQDDAIIPVEHSSEMHAKTPQSTLRILPECGHCPPFEKPDHVATLIVDWITAQENVVVVEQNA
ncbi:alpha/beta hydrolase [uncultured Roseibium sp.]|uniref:alpha/beta fold hydrolase n=1 Tax=uncultured Roseibium sp. TaxID=1936171 RepID=UPI0026219536|nr:alpha/beta hydrolase [uncultured Roseibium sp.]